MSEHTKEAKLEQLRKELNIEVLPEEEVDQETGLTMADRARLTASGLLFNWADEAIAGIKALSPNVTYEEASQYEEDKLKEAQAKKGSLAYEIGGAFLPTVGALIAAPFTGGTSAGATVPTWTRLVGVGASQGFLYGTGASEEEGIDRLKDAPVSTLTGAVTNPLFAKLSQKVQNKLLPVIDYARRTVTGKVGKNVEDELIRIVQDSGFTIDEIIEKVSKGEIIPEMSEEAAKVVAGFASKAGPGSAIIRNAINSRKNEFVENVYSSLQKDLAPDVKNQNIFKTFADNTKKLEKSESDAYDAIWESTAGQTFDEIDGIVLGIAQKSKQSRARINKYLDDNGFPDIFKVNKRGELELKRSLTLEEGEIIKRAFMDAKTSAKNSGLKNKSKTMGEYENEVKEILDGISPELQKTRQNWAMIKDAVDKYEIGKKVFGQNPEEFAVEFQKLVDAGNEDAIAALRAGAASALKLKSMSPSALGTITKLADRDLGLNQKERVILEILYPGELLEDIITKINQARGSIVASSRTFGGSPTRERGGAADRVGIGQTVTNLGRILTSGGADIGAAKNIVSSFFRAGEAPEFTNKEYEKIAELIISDDPEVLRKALTDTTKIDGALQIIRKAIEAVSASQPRVLATTTATEDVGEFVDPIISDTLSGIVGTISPSTAEKIQQAVQ